MNKLVLLAFCGLFTLCASEVLRIFPQNVDLTPCPSHPLCNYKGYGNWRHLERSQKSQDHTIVFAVTLVDDAADTCENVLRDISTPGSDSFGKHLTLDEVTKLTSSRRSARAVLHWLSSFDLISVDAGVTQDFIKVKASAAVLEEMFQTELHNFQNSKGNIITRAAFYALPENIARHVDFVGNLVNIPNIESTIMIAASKSDGTVTPAFLNQIYNINNNQVSNGASQAVFEGLGQDYSPDDLSSFQSSFNLPNQAINQVIGHNDPSQCISNPDSCGEANLDVQYIMAIAQNSNMTYWSIESDVTDPFLNWILAVSQDPNPPQVHSVSYGSLAPEDPANDVYRFNTEVCKLGLRGITVVVASGDDGVANFIARNDPNQCGFTPSFPATSPYVVAVGATSGPEVGEKEVACSSVDGNIITTGGGFSYFFNRPSYQEEVVNHYLKHGPKVPPLKKFNSTGRAYPDVALIGVQYQIMNGGQQQTVFGTSASTPVFAAILTLINGMRLASGKSTLGFITPTLYSIAAESGQNVFNDITSGTNNCCAGQQGSQVCCKYGFTATTGWDPLTGLGSINFQNLADKLVSV